MHTDARRAETWPWFLLALIVLVHGGLLVSSVNDYWPDNDLGYHISLARQYANHGIYPWDSINYAPAGRPNLQGPLLHIANGALGRLLGGKGDDYVLAFSLLAILQWAVAAFTAVFFARRLGGPLAALVAVALFTGAIYSAASFFVGVPSGWVFLFAPWAIHFFLARRFWWAALFVVLGCYAHLGGGVVLFLGVLLAAVWQRDWVGLLKTAVPAGLLYLPYVIHFLRHWEWYRGERGHVAGSAAWLIYLLAVPAVIWLWRRGVGKPFLYVWAAAPLFWLFQDPLRLFLQSTVAASVLAGLFVERFLDAGRLARYRSWVLAGLLALSQIFPLSIPSLPLEFAWARGLGFPRELEWREARSLAEVWEKAKLNKYILSSYYGSLGCAMAVYTDVRQEKGHWHEVQPKYDPAQDLSAGEKAYLIPVNPRDELLEALEDAGLIQGWGGTPYSSLITLPRRAPLSEAGPVAANIIEAESAWLSERAVNNQMPPLTDLFSRRGLRSYRTRLTAQKNHAGRLQVAVLVYAYAMEGERPEDAKRLRTMARWLGSSANFVGDETAIDYVSEAKFLQFQTNLKEIRKLSDEIRQPPYFSQSLNNKIYETLQQFF